MNPSRAIGMEMAPSTIKSLLQSVVSDLLWYSVNSPLPPVQPSCALEVVDRRH